MVAHPRVAFFYRDFRLYFFSRLLVMASHQMVAVAVGQAVYEITKSPLHLGYVGLSFFLPKFGFFLFAGHAADRFDRWRVITLCRGIQFLATLGLIAFVFFQFQPLWILYALLFVMGSGYAFDNPANQAFLPHLVPSEHFQNAVTWSTSAMQCALIMGPALAGWFYGLRGPAFVFIIIAVMRFAALFFAARIKTRSRSLEQTTLAWKHLFGGLHYLIKRHIILGAISLDLFAVFLGGAVALLPIYANDILHVGPQGLGVLRAAPAIGAGLMALVLAYFPVTRKAGSRMLWCVVIFGVATVFFGVSQDFFLSLLFLGILGAADAVSVVIRAVLVQMETPDDMRGRVSAINALFIGASNELGEFESGVTAAWFGVVPAVVIGGVGSIVVACYFAWRFPELRQYER